MRVVVDLTEVFKPSRVGSGATALRVQAYGLDNGDRVEGELYRWVQVRTGEWWAAVRFRAVSKNGLSSWALDQLVPAAAVRRAEA